VTALALLAEAREAGLELVPGDGDRLKVRGPLTPELRDRLTAAKRDLLGLLRADGAAFPAPTVDTDTGRRDIVQEAFRAVWEQLSPLVPDEVPAVSIGPSLARWWPAAARDLQTAEREAEATGLAFVRGHANRSAFDKALARYSDALEAGLERLRNGCWSCGSPDTAGVALVDPSDGHRTCGGCQRGVAP